MNLKTAEQLLPCYRAGREMDARVEKAVRVAEGDAELREKLRQQEHLDKLLVQVIHSIEPPEDLRRKLNALSPADPGTGRSLRSQLFQPAMLPVLLGVIVLLGLLGYVGWDRWNDFGGRDAVVHMLDVTKNMSGAELEPVHTRASQLGDWFYMRGFEGYSVPPEVAALDAVGSRVFRQGGTPIAQVAVDERNTLLFVFRAADAGVDLPDDQRWRYLEHDGWAGAVRRHGETCTLIAFRGNVAEMHSFLRDLEKK